MFVRAICNSLDYKPLILEVFSGHNVDRDLKLAFDAAIKAQG